MPAKKKTDPDAPKKKTLYTIKLTDEQMAKLKDWCERQLWIDYPVDYSRFAYKGDGVNIVAYTSGKLVIQGKKTEDFVSFVLEPEITGTPELGYEEINNPEWFTAHAGLDESGKGDFFGPLVSACVIADGEMVRKWMDAGVADSKKITSDNAILRLESEIRNTKGVVIETVFAGMEKYNALYHKFGDNVNKLLAWMHAKALETALPKNPVPWGLLDQFSKQPLVQRQLKDKSFDLQMRTKAESDPVVAAASIIARAEYIRQMEKLSNDYGEKLLRGAGANVKKQGIALVQKLGAEALPRFAKMHFRTSYEVRGLTPPPKTEWKKW